MALIEDKDLIGQKVDNENGHLLQFGQRTGHTFDVVLCHLYDFGGL